MNYSLVVVSFAIAAQLPPPEPEPPPPEFAAPSIGVGRCEHVEAQIQDASGAPAPLVSAQLLGFSSTSLTMQYFADADCTAPVASWALEAGATSFHFYVSDVEVGSS